MPHKECKFVYYTAMFNAAGKARSIKAFNKRFRS